MADVGMPRWVKVALGVALAVLLVVVLAMLTGVGGEHGPGRHSGLRDPSMTEAVGR